MVSLRERRKKPKRGQRQRRSYKSEKYSHRKRTQHAKQEKRFDCAPK